MQDSHPLIVTVLLLGAIGSFIGGVANFIRIWPELRSNRMRTGKTRKSTAVSLVLLVVSLALLVTWSLATGELPLNEKLTREAWDAYNRDHMEDAIARASECVDKFADKARREQSRLESSGQPELPTGSVSKETARQLFANGLLNDVAACLWILGHAAETLGQVEDAREAYGELERLTFARVWDKRGWFWPPSEDATDWLKRHPNVQSLSAKQPYFNREVVDPLREKASEAGISEMYLIASGPSMELLEDADRLIIWNAAAKSVYGSHDGTTTLGSAAVLEIGVNGIEGFNKTLDGIGIENGLRQDVLYEIWNRKLILSGTGEHSGERLLYQHWRGDTCGTAVATPDSD